MTPAIDEARLNQLVGQMLNDLGGAASVAMVRMGDALGLYKTLHEKGSMTSEELAKAAGAHERYVREWLAHQAASNYLTYDRTTGKFTLPPEQAMLFAIEDSPVTMLGAFDGVAAWAEGQPKVQAAFRHCGGVEWGDTDPVCSAPWHASSALATYKISSRIGCQHLMVLRQSCARVPGSLTSGAAMAGQRSSWHKHSPSHNSSASIFIPAQSNRQSARSGTNVSNADFQVGTAKD